MPTAPERPVPSFQEDKAAQQQQQATDEQRNKYHVVVSVNGNIYTQWQIRICFYWYNKVKAQNPGSAFGGFTRLLHG